MGRRVGVVVHHRTFLLFRCAPHAQTRAHPCMHAPLHPPAQRFTKRTGTPVYMAPEIFERDYYVEADM